jgi:hypothetical protein
VKADGADSLITGRNKAPQRWCQTACQLQFEWNPVLASHGVATALATRAQSEVSGTSVIPFSALNSFLFRFNISFSVLFY